MFAIRRWRIGLFNPHTRHRTNDRLSHPLLHDLPTNNGNPTLSIHPLHPLHPHIDAEAPSHVDGITITISLSQDKYERTDADEGRTTNIPLSSFRRIAPTRKTEAIHSYNYICLLRASSPHLSCGPVRQHKQKHHHQPTITNTSGPPRRTSAVRTKTGELDAYNRLANTSRPERRASAAKPKPPTHLQ